MGMLTSEDLNMSAEEFSKRIPGPGSYWYNIYAKEAPELLTQAEALREKRRQEAQVPVYRPPEPEAGAPAGAGAPANAGAGAPAMSAEDRRYQELLGRGVIDEQGNILRPDGINVTEIMRGDPPSWATPELIKNAYILAFESKARGGQDFMDSGDYQNFLDAGYSLTDEQVGAIGGVQGQGNQDDLTFGGGQPNTGVAQPAPAPAAPAPAAPDKPQVILGDMGDVDPRAVANVSGNSFMDSYSGFRGNQPQNPNAPASGPTQPPQSTPFADAYMRAKQAAEAKGPVSSMFADVLGK